MKVSRLTISNFRGIKDADLLLPDHVDELFMHGEKGFEALVLKNTTQAAMERFVDRIDWPPHLVVKFPDPKADSVNALSAYFSWSKGDRSIADFLASCQEQEIPEWIRHTCIRLKALCQPEAPDGDDGHDGGEPDIQDIEDLV